MGARRATQRFHPDGNADRHRDHDDRDGCGLHADEPGAGDVSRRSPKCRTCSSGCAWARTCCTKDLIMAGAGTYMGAIGRLALQLLFADHAVPGRRHESRSRGGRVLSDRHDQPDVRAADLRADHASTRHAATATARSSRSTTGVELRSDKRRAVRIQGRHARPDHDVDGTWDYDITITNVQDEALHLQHSDKFTAHMTPARLSSRRSPRTPITSRTDATTNTYQLMHYDGTRPTLPVVDNVVKLNFALLRRSAAADAACPEVAMRRRRRPVDDVWPEAAVHRATARSAVRGQARTARSRSRTAHRCRACRRSRSAGQVELTQAMLTDGPWCPTDTSGDRYRRRPAAHPPGPQSTLRVQAALASLRGPAGTLFSHGGTANEPENATCRTRKSGSTSRPAT